MKPILLENFRLSLPALEGRYEALHNLALFLPFSGIGTPTQIPRELALPMVVEIPNTLLRGAC